MRPRLPRLAPAAAAGQPAAVRRKLLAAAFALPVVAACSAIPPLDLKSPKIAVSGLSVRSLGLSEIAFLLTLNADNPNEVDIPLTDLVFDLELFGQPFASGAAQERSITLPRLASREVPIAFTVPTSKLVELISRLTGSDGDRFTYRLKGSAKWGSSPFPISFDKQGDLEALRQLEKLLRSPVR